MKGAVCVPARRERIHDMHPVAVIVPVYNEERILSDNIRRLVSYLDGVLPGYEIIIGSNGSTDGTVVIGEQLAAAYPAITFSHTDKRGVGYAFGLGLSLTEAEKIITADVDLTTDPDFIPRAYALLDEYDIVIGSKLTGSQRRSAVRIAGSTLYTRSVNRLLGLPFGDYSIGAKGYRRDIVMEHFDPDESGSSYVVDIIYRSWHEGTRIAEIPVGCSDVRGSHFNLIHEGICRFYRLVRLWWGER